MSTKVIGWPSLVEIIPKYVVESIPSGRFLRLPSHNLIARFWTGLLLDSSSSHTGRYTSSAQFPYYLTRGSHQKS